MDVLRREHLFVNQLFLNGYNETAYATLEIGNRGIKNQISKEDKVTEWFPIYANSFGPFNPYTYFESKVKILWLLKEPLITKHSWIIGDRGGHDQALEYSQMGADTENNTISHLLEITHGVLKRIRANLSIQEIENHTCILEVNQFPGLHFKSYHSNGDLLFSWNEINSELIQPLLNFYNPSLIFFAHTLEILNPNFKDFSKVQTEFNSNTLDILDDKIVEWAYINAETKNEILIKGDYKFESSKIVHVGRNFSR